MKPRALTPGDVVQLNPEYHVEPKQGFFGGCFMLVTEPKAFGAQGFIAIVEGRGFAPGAAFYRANWDEMEYVGRATWIPEPGQEKAERPTDE